MRFFVVKKTAWVGKIGRSESKKGLFGLNVVLMWSTSGSFPVGGIHEKGFGLIVVEGMRAASARGLWFIRLMPAS
jgi:hypothetical protein